MKKIDRKACLAHIDPKFHLNKDNGLFLLPQVQFVVKTAIKNIGHRKLLVLYLYPRAAAAQGVFCPDYAVFQASDTFLTYDNRPEVKTKWRVSALERLEKEYRFTDHLAFYSRQDEARVLSFCRMRTQTQDTMSGFAALSALQDTIVERRSAKGKREREQKIIDRMRAVRPAGKRLERWAKRDVLPKYITYVQNKKTKKSIGVCTACGHEVTLNHPEHNKSCNCPSCGRTVTLKSRGRTRKIRDRSTVLFLQRLGARELILRVFKVTWFYFNGETSDSFYENARIFITWDGSGQFHSKEFYRSFNYEGATPWRHGARPYYPRWAEHFEAEDIGHLFTQNLRTVLKETPWQYSELAAFYNSDHIPLDVKAYLREFLKKPVVEYLNKLKLYRLAAYAIYHYGYDYSGERKDCLNISGRNLREVLGIGMEDLPLLQAINASYGQLGLLQDFRQAGLRPDKDLLIWCGEHEIYRLRDIRLPLKYVTPHKLIRYINEQFKIRWEPPHPFARGGYGYIKDVLSDYKDYLLMCVGLKYDMKNSFVLLPKSLKAAHDQVMALTKADKAAVYDPQIVSYYEAITNRYGFRADGMMIVAPRSAQDIIHEGQELRHCVGNYVQDVAAQDKIILFLRKEDDPQKSYCTIEVNDGKIQQARGYNNAMPPLEAQKFLEQWRKQVLERPIPQDCTRSGLAAAA